ncbi:hypothetical protein D8674_017661 [Pyrus ussuriensis x Pyrus communis]|uniref:Uncharacterized protein n=1 Tax=Pyrus ussuriensis x Pyrus communis TaxID=2448454 RepID=A0A5N5HIH5_9ROSA|nr:hypothetical protein D8674_017661 [Pyrus ussuriensis x Pyrus communis]
MSSSRAWWQHLERVGNSTKGGFVVFDLTDIVTAMEGKKTRPIVWNGFRGSQMETHAEFSHYIGVVMHKKCPTAE